MLRDHGAGVRWEIDVAETYSARRAIPARRLARARPAPPRAARAVRSIAAMLSRSSRRARDTAASRGCRRQARRSARAARGGTCGAARRLHVRPRARDLRELQPRAVCRRRGGRRARAGGSVARARAHRSVAPAAHARRAPSPARAARARRSGSEALGDARRRARPRRRGVGHGPRAARARLGVRVARRGTISRCSTRSTPPRIRSPAPR